MSTDRKRHGAPRGYTQGYRRPAIRSAIQGGATTVVKIAESVGLGRSTVRNHLYRMKRDGEVRQIRPWGERAAKWVLR